MPATTSTIFTLMSKPGCVQCNATVRHFESKGLLEGRDYVVHDVTRDAEALKQLQELNYAQAPVVFFGDDHWSGYRPDKIDAHLLSLQPA